MSTLEIRDSQGDIEARIARLESICIKLVPALESVIRALALGNTTYRDEYVHQHGLCGDETAPHLVDAARLLAMNLGELGLEYWDRCPHGEVRVFCNECQGMYDEPWDPHPDHSDR